MRVLLAVVVVLAVGCKQEHAPECLGAWDVVQNAQSSDCGPSGGAQKGRLEVGIDFATFNQIPAQQVFTTCYASACEINAVFDNGTVRHDLQVVVERGEVYGTDKMTAGSCSSVLSISPASSR